MTVNPKLENATQNLRKAFHSLKRGPVLLVTLAADENTRPGKTTLVRNFTDSLKAEGKDAGFQEIFGRAFRYQADSAAGEAMSETLAQATNKYNTLLIDGASDLPVGVIADAYIRLRDSSPAGAVLLLSDTPGNLASLMKKNRAIEGRVNLNLTLAS